MVDIGKLHIGLIKINLGKIAVTATRIILALDNVSSQT